jgi:Ca2+-binding RTX toxin-like protein
MISGGPGADAATYGKAPAGVNVDLGRHQATGWGTDRLTGVETALGSRFGDVLLGDAVRNHLVGAQGDDQLTGRAGGDLLDGGPGTDVADGGAGADLCIETERSVRCS